MTSAADRSKAIREHRNKLGFFDKRYWLNRREQTDVEALIIKLRSVTPLPGRFWRR